MFEKAERKEIARLFIDNCEQTAKRFIEGTLSWEEFEEVACTIEDLANGVEDEE